MREPATVVASSAVSPAALRDAFNASFADYLLRFQTLDDAGWQSFVARQGIDLLKGFVARRGDVATAFALITPRPGRRTRIAVMGARPDERGSGIAKRLLDDAIAAAIARDDRWIELEVFAQNERAAQLYRSRGMEPVDTLYGYTAAPGDGMARDSGIVEVSREEAAPWADDFDGESPAILPWQVGGDAMRRTPLTMTAWRIGGAQIVFQDASPLVVTSLLDRDPAQRDAFRLIAALRYRYAERALRAPQLHCALGAARAFEEASWVREPLHQLLLRRQICG